MEGDVSAMDSDVAVLVEFQSKPGVQAVSRSPAELLERSAKALDQAMITIQYMARRVAATMSSLDAAPEQVEVGFGLNFDIESGVVVARAGVGASINVNLIWKPQA